MDTLKIFIVLFIGGFVANAQDLRPSEVPEGIVANFEKTFANANDVEWERQGEGFSVEFEEKRMDREIWYDASGEILRAEKELMENDLPAAIKKNIKTDYAGFQIEDAEMREEKGETTYFVELEKKGMEKNIRFDTSGKVLDERVD